MLLIPIGINKNPAIFFESFLPNGLPFRDEQATLCSPLFPLRYGGDSPGKFKRIVFHGQSLSFEKAFGRGDPFPVHKGCPV
jgi:hypothetical protein